MVAVYGRDFPGMWSDWMDGFCGVYKDKVRKGDLCIMETSDVRCPSLVVHGVKDAMCPMFHAEFLAERLRDCSYVTFAEGKHNLHLRYHERFNKLVSDFLLKQKYQVALMRMRKRNRTCERTYPCADNTKPAPLLSIMDESWPQDELLKACEAGDIVSVKRIVEDGSNESARLFDALPTTPLHCAALGGHLEIVRYLVEEKACDVTCGDDFGSTPFIHAALGGKLDTVKYLYSIGGTDLMYPPDAMGITALHVACMGDDGLEVVKFLIDNGADLSRCDDNGITPLHMAAEGGSLSVVKFLLEEKECDSEPMSADGDTPLFIAALGNKLEVFKYLTAKWGCNPKCKNKYGKTPLHGASQRGHLDVVRTLVEDHNVDPTCRDGEGNTPLHVACLFGHLLIIQYFIEDRLCNPETKNSAGVTLEKMVNEKGYIYHNVTTYIRRVISILASKLL